MTYPFVIERPKTLEAASRRLAALGPKGAAIGGGLEILDQFRRSGASRPDVIIPIRQIGATSFIEVRGGFLRVGSTTTLAEIADSTAIRGVAWPLSQAAADTGTPQIRAQATIAGSILQRPRCWYFRSGAPCAKNGGQDCFARLGENRYHAILDGGPTHSVFQSDVGLALMAMNARVVLSTPDGEKTINMTDLYTDPHTDVTREHQLGYGDIVKEIWIPQLSNRFTGTFLKIRERAGADFALVSVAVTYNNYHGRFKDVRIYMGGVAPRPYFPQKTFEYLMSNKLGREWLLPAAELAVEGAEALQHNAYKIGLAKTVVHRALLETYDRLTWKPD